MNYDSTFFLTAKFEDTPRALLPHKDWLFSASGSKNCIEYLAFVSRPGKIELVTGNFSQQMWCAETDDNILSLIMVDISVSIAGTPRNQACAISVHEGDILRVWSCDDGTLIKEQHISEGVRSIHALSFGNLSSRVAFESNSRDVYILDLNTSKRVCSLKGYSKATALRQIKTSKDMVALIDGYGQVFVYNSEGDLLLTEKKFNECFSVALDGNLLILLCPVKTVIYKCESETFVPYQSILTDDPSLPFRGVSIFGSDKVVAWTDSFFFDVLEERRMNFKGNHFPKIVKLFQATNSVLLTDSGIFCLDIFDDEIFVYEAPIPRPKEPGIFTIASDGAHLFLVRELTKSDVKVYPLSIPDTSFELELPSESKCGSLTCLSGTSVPDHIVAGLSKGFVCTWLVGTSSIETLINIHSFSAKIVSLVPIQTRSGSAFGAVDDTGVVSIIKKDELVMKIQPNDLLNNHFFVSFHKNEISCTFFDPVSRRHTYEEKWEVSSQELISSAVLEQTKKAQSVPVARRAVSSQSMNRMSDFFSNLVGERRASATDIVHIEDADIPIEDEFYTMAPQVYLDSRQRIVAPILNRWRSNSALREMFVHLMETATMGISKKSDLTNTFQTSFGRNKTIERLFEKLALPSRGEKIRKEPVKAHGYDIDVLLDLLDSDSDTSEEVRNLPSPLLETSAEKMEYYSAIIEMISDEVTGLYNEAKSCERLWNLYKTDVNKYRIIVYVLLSIAPHELPGYREAMVTEEEGNEWIIFTYEYLKRIFSNQSFVELKFFPKIFNFIRKFIKDTHLFNEIFVILFANIVDVSNHANLIASITDEDNSSTRPPITVAHRIPCTVAAKYVSEMSLQALLAIGFRNPSKFAKRLSTLIKTTHTSEVPIYLINRFVQTYCKHSIMHIPMLFEIVILPCLDPMDYRIRRNSIGPATNLFRVLNRKFPMTTFHQGKQKFAIGSTQGQVIIFDIRSATKWRVLDGHTGPISAVGYDQSGKYLCSYSATDYTVRVWHITGSGVTAGPVVISANSIGSSLLGGLLGSTGGKCIQVKQLGPLDEGNGAHGIGHPFNLIYRINSVKIRWTSENDILLVRENGHGIQIRI